MENVKTQKVTTPTIVNFFDIGFDKKRHDWRYEEYEKLSGLNKGDHDKKTIYWVGIVDLIPVRNNVSEYPLSFLYWNKKMVKDTYVNRDVDGAPLGDSMVLYDLKIILDDLLKARAAGQNYFQIFLKETVYPDGEHQVDLLYQIDKEKKPLYGIATKRPWFEEPIIQWIEYATTNLSEHIKKECILGEGWYNWQK